MQVNNSCITKVIWEWALPWRRKTTVITIPWCLYGLCYSAKLLHHLTISCMQHGLFHVFPKSQQTKPLFCLKTPKPWIFLLVFEFSIFWLKENECDTTALIDVCSLEYNECPNVISCHYTVEKSHSFSLKIVSITDRNSYLKEDKWREPPLTLTRMPVRAIDDCGSSFASNDFSLHANGVQISSMKIPGEIHA